MALAAVALGSNLGDRQAALQQALRGLAGHLGGLVVSEFIDTAPEGVGDQPRFLNAAAVGEWGGDARALLDVLMDIERAAGRTRPHPGEQRTVHAR